MTDSGEDAVADAAATDFCTPTVASFKAKPKLSSLALTKTMV